MTVALGVADGTAEGVELAIGGLVAGGASVEILAGIAADGPLAIATIVEAHVGMASLAAMLAVVVITSVALGAQAVSTISGRNIPAKRQLFNVFSILNASPYPLMLFVV